VRDFRLTPRCSRGVRRSSRTLYSVCSCLIYQSTEFILQLLNENRTWTEDPLTDSKLMKETDHGVRERNELRFGREPNNRLVNGDV
jgi:hypothetical protein